MCLVSVIVPNYNHELFLKERLDSIVNQSYKNIEIIILDDASTDGSCEIINSYKSHPKVSKILINKKKFRKSISSMAKRY